MTTDYYTFMLLVLGFVLLPMYLVASWKSYYREKQREKTLREAIRQ